VAKVRVLHCCNVLDLGGEKSILVHAKYADKSKFEVFVCGRVQGGRRVAEFQKQGIPVYIAPQSIDELLKELSIDIYHVWRSGDYEPGSLPRQKPKSLKIVETNIFNAVDHGENHLINCHLFPSEFCKQKYLRTYGAFHGKRYETLYHPIDFEEFPWQPKPFQATFGRVSRSDDQKWHDICVKIIPKVFQKIPEAQCLIMGATEKKLALMRSLGVLERVQLCENSLDVASFYRRLDVFTHGSRVGETFGCVIAEAMANRLPVVTISTPQRKKSNAQAELVEHNVTGFVCRFTWQYADAVIELLENHTLRERFAERGYEKARDQFEAAQLTRKLEALYTELMDMGNA